MARGMVMLSRAKLIEMAKDMGINPYHLEKDYVLTLIYQQISSDPELYNNLILKGGLALHHIYGNTRLSIDLDFTARKRIEVDLILDTIEAVAGLRIRTPQDIPATKFSLRIRPISYLGPLGVRSNVEIEVSYREEVVLEPDVVPLVNRFCDSFPVQVMKLEEMMAEKIRALYQRPKASDLYDLHFILSTPALSYDTSTINDLIPIKFKLVAGGWNRSRLFRHIEDLEALWETHLSSVLLEACPSFDEAVDVVARKLKFLRK